MLTSNSEICLPTVRIKGVRHHASLKFLVIHYLGGFLVVLFVLKREFKVTRICSVMKTSVHKLSHPKETVPLTQAALTVELSISTKVASPAGRLFTLVSKQIQYRQ